MRSRRRTLLLVCVALPSVLAVIALWMMGGLALPAVEHAPIRETTYGRPAPTHLQQRLKVVSYNMHFGIGRDDDHTKVKKADVLAILDRMAELFKRLDADIVLLQEVDYDSARTFGIDQLDYLAKAAGYRYLAPVVTWKKGYIPFPYWPISAHYGHMLSGQAVMSRFEITQNTAIRLPKPQDNPFWYNIFYLRRTLQEVTVTIGGRDLKVFNVHTEAFDLKNRQLQAELIVAHVKTHALPYTVMAGDFNAVPPEASRKHNFADEPETDMRPDKSVETVRLGLPGLLEIIPMLDYRFDESAALTFPADIPNRRLDYFYYSQPFQLVAGRVVHEAGTLSDHLPTVAELNWPGN